MSRSVGLKGISLGMGVAPLTDMGVAIENATETAEKGCEGGPLQTSKQTENGEVAFLVQTKTNSSKCFKLNKEAHVNNTSSLAMNSTTESLLMNKIINRVTTEMLPPSKQSVPPMAPLPNNSTTSETVGVKRTLASTANCASSTTLLNSTLAPPVSSDHKHKRIKLIRSPIAVELTNPNKKSEPQDTSTIAKSCINLEKETCDSVKDQAEKSSTDLVNSDPQLLPCSSKKLKTNASSSPNKQIKEHPKCKNAQFVQSSGNSSQNTASNAKQLGCNSSTVVKASLSNPTDVIFTHDDTPTNLRSCVTGLSKKVISIGVAEVASLKKSELVDGRDSVRITGKDSAYASQLNNGAEVDSVKINSDAISKESEKLKTVQSKTDRKTRQFNCYANISGEPRTAATNSSVPSVKCSSVVDLVCKVPVNKCPTLPSQTNDLTQKRISEASHEPSLKDRTSEINPPNTNSCKDSNKLKSNVCNSSNASLIQRPSLELRSSSSTVVLNTKNVSSTNDTRRHIDGGQSSLVSVSKIRTSNSSISNNANECRDQLHYEKVKHCSVGSTKEGLNHNCSTNADLLTHPVERKTLPITASPCAFTKATPPQPAELPSSKLGLDTSIVMKSTTEVGVPNRIGNGNQSITDTSGTTPALVTPSVSCSAKLSVHSTTHAGAAEQGIKSDSSMSHGFTNKTSSTTSSIIKPNPVKSAVGPGSSSVINYNNVIRPDDSCSSKCLPVAPRAQSSSSSQTSESDDSFESAKGDSFDGAFCSGLLHVDRVVLGQAQHGEFGEEEEEEEDDTDTGLIHKAHTALDDRGEQKLEEEEVHHQHEDDEEEHNSDDVPHKPIFETEEEIGKRRRRSNLKRKISEEPEPSPASDLTTPTTIDESTSVALPSLKRPRRGIKFDGVTVFYFPRSQGFSCVPSQGGSTLGMARRHFHIKKFSITDHLLEQRQIHKLNRLKRIAEEESSGDGSNNCYLNRKPLAVESSSSSLYPSSSFESPVAASVGKAVSEAVSGNLSHTGQQTVALNSTGHAISNASHTTSTATITTTSTNGVVALSFGMPSSDDDTEEDGSELSESEIDSDFCFLQPLAIRQRRSLLRESGIKAIESVEKEECKDIRISREMCGCQCKLYCFPDTCQCIEAGIKCQVDRHNFPCGCSVQGCGNPHGRIEFNPIRVRTHFLHTLMRLEIEKRQAEQRAVFQHQQRSRWEEQRSRWLACLGSPLPALPPCSAAPEADSPHQPGADGTLDGR